MATLLVSTSFTTQAQGDNLVYVAVDPCRLADTRPTEGGTGALSVGSSRNFSVYGADLSGQGGDASGCLHPREASGVEPVAISAYVVAVPTASSGPGHITAYASDGAIPGNALATVNFEAGQVNGNTTNVPLCIPGATACPLDGQMAVIAFSSEQNVVIDVQGYYYPATGTCPDDMVPVGSLCVDKYEASLVDANGTATTSAACLADGSNCADDSDATTPVNSPIFAQSVAGPPATAPSWFQAAIACANVGKRLPSSAEWQMAAAGTVAANCNAAGGALANTGAFTDCVSTAGAFDMVGNLWEWTADLTPDVAKGNTTSANSSIAAGFGESHANLGTPGTDSMFLPNDGAIAVNPVFGFRCVR